MVSELTTLPKLVSNSTIILLCLHESWDYRFLPAHLRNVYIFILQMFNNYYELLCSFFLKQATVLAFIHNETQTMRMTFLVLGYWVWIHLSLILSPVDFTVPWCISLPSFQCFITLWGCYISWNLFCFVLFSPQLQEDFIFIALKPEKLTLSWRHGSNCLQRSLSFAWFW